MSSSSKNGTLSDPETAAEDASTGRIGDPSRMPLRQCSASFELQHSLAEIKGQAQFLLYLADQIEESLDQLMSEADLCHGAFLCKVLTMYSGQLESKHQGLGEKIAEACQEVYVTVRERELA
jgi:hypothetical protein